MKTKKWIIVIITAVLVIPVYSFVTVSGNGPGKNQAASDSIANVCPYYPTMHTNARTGMMPGYMYHQGMNGEISNETMQQHYALMQQHHAAMQGMMMNHMGMNGQTGSWMNSMNSGNMHQGGMNGRTNHHGINQMDRTLKNKTN